MGLINYSFFVGRVGLRNRDYFFCRASVVRINDGIGIIFLYFVGRVGIGINDGIGIIFLYFVGWVEIGINDRIGIIFCRNGLGSGLMTELGLFFVGTGWDRD